MARKHLSPVRLVTLALGVLLALVGLVLSTCLAPREEPGSSSSIDRQVSDGSSPWTGPTPRDYGLGGIGPWVPAHVAAGGGAREELRSPSFRVGLGARAGHPRMEPRSLG